MRGGPVRFFFFPLMTVGVFRFELDIFFCIFFVGSCFIPCWIHCLYFCVFFPVCVLLIFFDLASSL